MASLQDLLKLYNAAASLMFLTFVLARLGTGHRIHDLEDRAWWYYRSIAVLVCWTHEYFLGNSDPTFAVALLFLFFVAICFSSYLAIAFSFTLGNSSRQTVVYFRA